MYRMNDVRSKPRPNTLTRAHAPDTANNSPIATPPHRTTGATFERQSDISLVSRYALESRTVVRIFVEPKSREGAVYQHLKRVKGRVRRLLENCKLQPLLAAVQYTGVL